LLWPTGEFASGTAPQRKWSLRKTRRSVSRDTDGQGEISPGMQERLRQRDIVVHTEKIARLEGTNDGNLHTIHLHGGMALKRSAMFFTTGCVQNSDLSASLGCIRDQKAASSAAVSPRKAAFPAFM
jgi:hypothetical protein